MSEFLAEARVVIRPDTTRFRAELLTAITQATTSIPPVAIPVVAQVAGGTAAAGAAATAAQRELAASMLASGAAAEKERASVTSLTAAEKANAAASHSLALAQAEVTTAASALSAAQVTATRSIAAVASAQRAVEVAVRSGNAALIEAANTTLRLAQAQEAEAVSALRAARAQAAHAETLGAVNTAAIASGASILGLRGAVLTAGAAFLGATVAIQATVRAIRQAADLETQLNVFRVTAGATADEMERVSEAAQDLGRDVSLPGVTAGQAAEALTELAKAGLDVQDSVDGARGVLQLATAAQIDNAQAAQLSANALNAFGLAGTDATRVADLLAGAAQESQGTIEDLGIGLRQVAGAAALLGLSVEDTVALLTQLTRAGLAGSDAGTTLRVALVRLARPDTRKEVEALVGSLQDLQGNLDPKKIVELAEEIDKSGGTLDKTNKLYELFGENSLRVIGLLANEGVPGFEAISDSITKSGLAADTAAARMAGLEGDIENLKNQADALGLTFAQVVVPPLSVYADLIADVVRRQTDVTRSNIETAESAKGIGERFIEMATGSETAGQKVGDLAEKAVGLGARMQLLGPVTLAASLAIDKFADSSEQAAPALDQLAESVKNTIADLNNFFRTLGRVATAGGGATGLNVQQIVNRVAGFDEAETQARIRGNTNDLLAVLSEEQAFLEQQLSRAAVQRREPLRRQLKDALLGVINDIAGIQREAGAEATRAANDAARAQREADEAFLDLLSNRRDDAERRAAAAAQTEGLGDDIRAQDRIQALIKIQIAKIRSRVKDEQARKNAIRELRIALIASRQEEDELRKEQKAQALTARQTSVELDIAFAETTGNVNREVAARLRLITLLKKQQAAVKKGTNEWKRLRNEIAEQEKAIKEAKKQAEKTGKSVQELQFEFLQQQQGFAANLLGNLIPLGATAGLVGNISQPTTRAAIPPSGLIGTEQEAAVAAGRELGPSSGQASTTNELLRRILRTLENLNGRAGHPEARYQRAVGSASFDIQ